jgi:hypothetical protein
LNILSSKYLAFTAAAEGIVWLCSDPLLDVV